MRLSWGRLSILEGETSCLLQLAHSPIVFGWVWPLSYCGMMIATLAAARYPMIRLLHRWETVSHWPHIICRVKHGWFPNLSDAGGVRLFRYMGGASCPYRKSLGTKLLQHFQFGWKGLRSNFIWFMYCAICVCMMA